MAFLDNSGDIILDAVLTDTGRFRMARGDFKITKFALGDDEIDYALYNRNHPSGSSYYDLEILKTPVLEAFTNNTSLMKSKLLSITRTDILHLPILKLSDGGYANTQYKQTRTNEDLNMYVVTVDTNTEKAGNGESLFEDDVLNKGILKGSSREVIAAGGAGANHIMVEFGLDTLKISPGVSLPIDLQETKFIVEMDDRLGQICYPAGANAGAAVPVSFVDDDQIASYYISANAGLDAGLIRGPLDTRRGDGTANNGDNIATKHRIRGPRGRCLQFKIKPSINLQTSTYLFEKLGSTITSAGSSGTNSTNLHGFNGSTTFFHIDTFIRVTAATVGSSIDIPIRYIKKQS